MSENFNLQCDDLKNNIINILNQSGFPIVIIYYIIKDIYHDVENNYIGYLNTIRMKEAKQVQKKIDNIQQQISNLSNQDND